MAVLGSIFTIAFQKLSRKQPLIIPTLSSHSYKMVLLIRTDLQMSKGKVAAQCSHATLAAYKSSLKGTKHQTDWLKRWEAEGQAKITLKVENEDRLYDLIRFNLRVQLQKQARGKGLVCESIIDAGRTQIEAGTRTVLAIGPGPVELIDSITGKLKLY